MVEMWRVKYGFRFRLEKVIADRVTDKCVFVRGGKQRKETDGCRYFETFEEAYAFAEGLLSRRLMAAQNNAIAAAAELKNLKCATAENCPVSNDRL